MSTAGYRARRGTWVMAALGAVVVTLVSLIWTDRDAQSTLDSGASTAAYMLEMPLVQQNPSGVDTALDRLGHLQPFAHVRVVSVSETLVIDRQYVAADALSRRASSWIGRVASASARHVIVHDGERVGMVDVSLDTVPLVFRFLQAMLFGGALWGLGMVILSRRQRVRLRPASEQLPATRNLPRRVDDDMLDGMNSHFSTLLDNMVQLKSQMDSAYARLFYQATHDALTQVYNRFYFDLFLDHALDQAEREQAIFGIVFIDCNDFKQVNDEHGHLSGDNVLHEVAARLREAFMGHGDVFRYGGDEFAVLLNRLEDAETLNRLIASIPDLFQEPVRDTQGGQMIQVGVASGGALYPYDGRDANTLMRVADARMYQDKTR